MKKNSILIAIAALMAAGIIGYMHYGKVTVNHDFTVGIIQTASHPALDAARTGFITTLKDKLGDRITFIEQNAQGSIDTLQSIAQRMHSKAAINAFYTIATPALQALASTEHTRPIIFAAVSNPHILNLPTSSNIAGVTDMVSAHKQVELIKQLTPTAKTIALLYNTSEVNSVYAAGLIEKELRAANMQTLTISLQNEMDISTAVETACRKADALIAPADNSIASAINTISAIALKYSKPLFVSDGLLVKQGALASFGVNYYDCGTQAAHIMYTILTERKAPQHFGVVQPEDPIIMINKKTADRINITIPESLRATASDY